MINQYAVNTEKSQNKVRDSEKIIDSVCQLIEKLNRSRKDV